MNSIDGFDVGQSLGRGGFASVFSARNRLTGDLVAIKAVDKAKLRESNLLDRISNEVKIHALMEHNNIVRYIDSFEDVHYIYIVMERCSCGNLFRYLKKNGRLSESVAASIISQVLEAVTFMHTKGVVHRDLKLSNILLSDGLVVKLCDFGLAVMLEHPDEEHYTLCGTPNYIAPEVVSKRAHGFPVDLWSVGCLFYFLVTGAPAAEQIDVKDTMNKILIGSDTTVDAGLALSHGALNFMQCLLKSNPSKRANANEILRHPFLQIAAAGEYGYSNAEHLDSNSGSKKKNPDSAAQCSSRSTGPDSGRSSSTKTMIIVSSRSAREYDAEVQSGSGSMRGGHSASSVSTAVTVFSGVRRRFDMETEIVSTTVGTESRASMAGGSAGGGGGGGVVALSGDLATQAEGGVHDIRVKQHPHLPLNSNEPMLTPPRGRVGRSSGQNRSKAKTSSIDKEKLVRGLPKSNGACGDVSKPCRFSDLDPEPIPPSYCGPQISPPYKMQIMMVPYVNHGGVSSRSTQGKNQSQDMGSCPGPLPGPDIPLPPLPLSEDSAHFQSRSQSYLAAGDGIVFSSSWLGRIRDVRLSLLRRSGGLLSQNEADGSAKPSVRALTWNGCRQTNPLFSGHSVVSISMSLSAFTHPLIDVDVDISWPHPSLQPMTYCSDEGEVLIISPLGDVLLCSLARDQAGRQRRYRLCVRSKRPLTLLVGDVDEEMSRECEFLFIQRSKDKVNDTDEVKNEDGNENGGRNTTSGYYSYSSPSSIGTKGNKRSRGKVTKSDLFSDRLWVKEHDIRALPQALQHVQTRVARMLETIRRKQPQLVLYVKEQDKGQGIRGGPKAKKRHDVVSDYEPAINNGMGGEIICKCMLMSNYPLPDFCIQWADAMKLRYSLASGQLNVSGPLGDYQWDGDAQINDSGLEEYPTYGWADSAPPKLKPYVVAAQGYLHRCLLEDSLLRAKTEKGAGSTVLFVAVSEFPRNTQSVLTQK